MKQQMDDDEKQAIRLNFRERIQEMKATFNNNKNELDVTQSTVSTISESSESFGDDWSSSVPATTARKAPRCPHVLKAFSKQAKKSSAGVMQALDNAVSSSSPQATARPKLQRTESQRHRIVMDLHSILNKRQKPSVHKQKDSTTGKLQNQNKHNDKQEGEDEKEITQEDDEERSPWIFGTFDDDDEEWTCHSIRQRGARSRRASIC